MSAFPLAPTSPPALSIFPREAHAVWQALPETERAPVREAARAQVEPAFWDRLERPDSPMALVLWELVAQRFPRQYADAIAGAPSASDMPDDEASP